MTIDRLWRAVNHPDRIGASPADVAQTKRAQHARLSRMIAQLDHVIRSTAIEDMRDPDVAAVVEAMCEERALYERAAFAMIRDAVELEIVAS